MLWTILLSLLRWLERPVSLAYLRAPFRKDFLTADSTLRNFELRTELDFFARILAFYFRINQRTKDQLIAMSAIAINPETAYASTSKMGVVYLNLVGSGVEGSVIGRG